MLSLLYCHIFTCIKPITYCCLLDNNIYNTYTMAFFDFFKSAFSRTEEIETEIPVTPVVDPTLACDENMRKLFAATDKAVVIQHIREVNTAMKKHTLGAIENPEHKQRLCELLAVETPRMAFHQMTFGYFSIDLKAGEDVIATIELIHDGTIRCNRWKSDAELINSSGLLRFLAEQGFLQPLEDERKRQQKRDAKTASMNDWKEAAPKCFSRQFNTINRHSNDFVPALKQELDAEIPDLVQQIQQLLIIYGITLDHWSPNNAYEEAPNRILCDLEMQDVINAYLASDRSERITSGFGRYMCSIESKKTRKPYLKFVPQEVLTLLQQQFTALGDNRGIREMERLGMEKVKSAEKDL